MSGVPTEFDPLSIGGKNPFHGYVTDGLELLVDIEDATADADGKLQLWDIVSGQAMTMSKAYTPLYEERYEVRKIIFSAPEYTDNTNRQVEWVTSGHLTLSPYFQMSSPSHEIILRPDYFYVPHSLLYFKKYLIYPENFDIETLHSYSVSPFGSNVKGFIDTISRPSEKIANEFITSNGLFNIRAQPDATWDLTQNVRFRTLRVYSRELTEEEILHNYEVDKKRFNLT